MKENAPVRNVEVNGMATRTSQMCAAARGDGTLTNSICDDSATAGEDRVC